MVLSLFGEPRWRSQGEGLNVTARLGYQILDLRCDGRAEYRYEHYDPLADRRQVSSP